MREGNQFIPMIRHNQSTAGTARQRHRAIRTLLHSLGLLPRLGRGIRPGDGIVVVGYPLRGLLASEANVTTGRPTQGRTDPVQQEHDRTEQ